MTNLSVALYLITVGVLALVTLHVLLLAWVIDLARVVRRVALARPEPVLLPPPPLQFKVTKEDAA